MSISVLIQANTLPLIHAVCTLCLSLAIEVAGESVCSKVENNRLYHLPLLKLHVLVSYHKHHTIYPLKLFLLHFAKILPFLPFHKIYKHTWALLMYYNAYTRQTSVEYIVQISHGSHSKMLVSEKFLSTRKQNEQKEHTKRNWKRQWNQNRLRQVEKWFPHF